MSTFWRRNGLGKAIGGAVLGVAVVVAAACGRGGDEPEGDAAAGEVTALDYEVTPERYQRWVAAQQGLDTIPGLPAPPKIDPMRLREMDVNRAVAYLEGDARARAVLARAGISARDYVLTTVALDQALIATASGQATTAGASRAGGRAPSTPAGSGGAGRVAGTPSPGATSGTRTTAGALPESVLRAPPQLRVTGAPRRNLELVQQNRGEVVRVLRTMRFRIAEPASEDVTDTAVTRSDSVTVGKGVTVKWDVTVRRNRDTTGTKRPTPARPDSVRRDSTT